MSRRTLKGSRGLGSCIVTEPVLSVVGRWFHMVQFHRACGVGGP